METERQKMLAGELYDPMDPELVAARERPEISARPLMQPARQNMTNDAAYE